MIYDQHGLKFRYYLRRLTEAEHVASVYHREMEKVQIVEEGWYSNWDTDLPALFMNTIGNRKEIESFRRKWLKRQTFIGPWPKPSP